MFDPCDFEAPYIASLVAKARRESSAVAHPFPPVKQFEERAGPRPVPPHRVNFLLMSGSFVHKIIIAGCRCFAGPLPSGLIQRDHHAERGAGHFANWR